MADAGCDAYKQHHSTLTFTSYSSLSLSFILYTMEPRPILPSAIDLERRRLENTIDLDLHSLSLGSLHTTTASSDSHTSLPAQPSAPINDSHPSLGASFSSISSLEHHRGFGEGETGRGMSLVHPGMGGPSNPHGPHGTPRAAARKSSMMSLRSEMDSPVSTAGHHVSAVTLNAGVFRRGKGNQAHVADESDGDDFDPERSLGRLVGELGKVMGNVSTWINDSRSALTSSAYRQDQLHPSPPCLRRDHLRHSQRYTTQTLRTSPSP